MAHSPPTIAELMEDKLGPHQLGLLEAVVSARHELERAMVAYPAAIERAQEDPNISFGIIAHRLGMNKETVWRTLRSYRAKKRQMPRR